MCVRFMFLYLKDLQQIVSVLEIHPYSWFK